MYEERNANIIEDVLNKETRLNILNKYNISTSRLHDICLKHGIDYKQYFQHSPRYYKNKTNKTKTQTFNILKDLLDIGLTMDMIAEKYKITRQRVQQIYSSARKVEFPGLPIRVKGRQKHIH